MAMDVADAFQFVRQWRKARKVWRNGIDGAETF
jgi:hypothetical protein